MKWKVLTYGYSEPAAKSKHSSKQNVNDYIQYLLKMRLCQRLTLGISQKWVVGKILSEIFPYKNISLVFTHLNPNCLDM